MKPANRPPPPPPPSPPPAECFPFAAADGVRDTAGARAAATDGVDDEDDADDGDGDGNGDGAGTGGFNDAWLLNIPMTLFGARVRAVG